MEELTEAVKALGTPTCLDYAPIILSVIAVAVGIYFPSRIAKKQNQIAVFDKLFAAYSQLLLVKSFATAIKEYSFVGDSQIVHRNRELFCVHFEPSFDYHPNLSNYEESIGKAIAALRKCETQANMIPLLIAKNGKQQLLCSGRISAVFEPLFSLTTEIILFHPDKAEETDKLLKEFVRATDGFFSEYSAKIESDLRCR